MIALQAIGVLALVVGVVMVARAPALSDLRRDLRPSHLAPRLRVASALPGGHPPLLAEEQPDASTPADTAGPADAARSRDLSAPRPAVQTSGHDPSGA